MFRELSNLNLILLLKIEYYHYSGRYAVPCFLINTLNKITYNVTSKVPLAMLLILILHQTDDRACFQNSIMSKAIGTRKTVRMIPEIAGTFVLPHPKNAPVAVFSRHMNNCENPRIIKYSLPITMLSLSCRKIENNVPGKAINKVDVKTPIMVANSIPALKAFHCFT
jgi:hypothetical protein